MKNIPQSARHFKEKVTPLLIFFLLQEREDLRLILKEVYAKDNDQDSKKNVQQ